MSKLQTGNVFIKSIKVDNNEVHTGADLFYSIDEETNTITLRTEIGKNNKQKIEITLVKDDTKIIINENKISSN